MLAMTHIALLRAVNVAGHKMVAMADLRRMLEEMSYTDVRSLLQSGNLVFRGGKETGEKLERRLEAEARKRLGLETEFFVRTPDEWKAVVAHNSFREEARSDPGHLLVIFLKEAPKESGVKALQDAITGREIVSAHGRQAYIVYPDGTGRSRLTNALIERHLGTRGTGRNWNTVLKLGALAEA